MRDDDAVIAVWIAVAVIVAVFVWVGGVTTETIAITAVLVSVAFLTTFGVLFGMWPLHERK